MPFQRISQRGADEPAGVLQDVGDGASGELVIVPGQYDVGQKNALTLSLDDTTGFLVADAGAAG